MRALGASRTSVAPGGALAGGWTRNALWKTARAVPSLDLRFADNKTLGDAYGGGNPVTFTRASSGTFVGSDGLLKTAATNEPRFDHNPTTGESLGLLVEEARTNSIRNNTMVGAVAGTPGTLPTNWSIGGSGLGTLTQTIVGTGTSNGITYVDIRFNGTTSTTDFCIVQEPTTQIAALTGQVWAASTWVAVVGGSTNNISTAVLNIAERTSIGTLITQQSGPNLVSTINSTLTRYSAGLTLNGGATTAFVQPRLLLFTFSLGVAIDVTLRIGLPQLELGAFATSVIPTTTATVTRAADVASITGSNFSSWYRQDQSTWYSEVNNQVLSTDKRIVWVTDSTNTPSYGLRMPNNNTFQMGAFNSGTFSVTSPGTVTVGLIKQAGAIASNDIASVANGLAVGTSSTWTLFTADKVRLGADTLGTACVNGAIKRLTYWPTRLSNTTLQQITQP